jgi:hypothetical protein
MLPRALLFRLVRTVVVVWIAARAALMVLAIVRLSPLGIAGFSLLIPVLTRLDIRASSEHLFHGNLAIRPRQVSLIALVVAFVLTLAFETVLAALHIGMPPDPLL